MKLVAAILACACLAGNANAAQSSSDARDGKLIAIAERGLKQRHWTSAGLMPSVADRGDVWRVYFAHSDPNTLDGGITVVIDKKTQRVLLVSTDG